MIIYMATNLVNGKQYVGQTVGSLEKRKWKHINCALNNNDNSYFHNALRKYGVDLFEWTVIDKCTTIEQLNRLEIFYIGFYDTFGKGYNLTEGGNGSMGHRHSEESRLRMSLAKKGKMPSEATIMGRRNKRVSEEIKRKLSEMNKGKNNPMYGRSISEETIEKISGENNHNARGVVVKEKYFPTLRAAAKFLDVVQTTVVNRLKKKVNGYSYV